MLCEGDTQQLIWKVLSLECSIRGDTTPYIALAQPVSTAVVVLVGRLTEYS